MSFTFSTSGAAIKTAGINVNSAIVLDVTQLDIWSNEAEAEICGVARYDCVTNWDNLTSYGRMILSQIHDCKVAQKIINYEPETIGLTGATLRLNYLQTQIANGVSNIDDGKIKHYLNIPS
jgi:hypothetical protein